MRGSTSVNRWLERVVVVMTVVFLISLMAPLARAAAADGGVADAGSADAGPPDASSTDAGSSKTSGVCAEGTRLIEQYRELYGRPAPPGLEDGGGSTVPFRHVIALVPDPVESRYPDYFDSAREGTEESVAVGIGDGGYLRDRSWLPWPNGDAERGKRRCWESQPGVLLFRPPGNPASEPAIVALLVGETPTSGLNERQFEAALATVDRLNAWWPVGNVREYRILGPTFSGTAASMSAVIARKLSAPGPSPVRFSIAWGTATSTEVRRTLERAQTASDAGSSTLQFWQATPNDDELLGTLIDYLCARGGQCTGNGDPNIALESLTTYGSVKKDARYFELKFPPSLAPIRNVDPSLAGVGADPYADASPPPSTVTTDLSGDTALGHDLALGAVLRDLSARRVRFVGVVATDARDVIFLADRIRQQVPDVRLFTLSTDVRFLDPSYAHFLNGMLIAHSAPALSDAGADDSEPVPLQNEFVRNVFLAGRHLLVGESPEVRVRISLVGNGAFWQIGPDPRAAGGPDQPKVAAARPRAPVSWWFILCFFVVAFVGGLLLVISPWIGAFVDKCIPSAKDRVGFLRHRGVLWALVGWCEHADLRADDRIVTASLLTVAACPVALMLVSHMARSGDDPRPLMSGVVGLAVVAILVISLSYVVRIWKDLPRVSFSTLVLAALATLASLLALGLGCGPQREATLNLMSGGSPVIAGLIGLGMLGLGLWCWRTRLRFLDTHYFGAGERLFDQIDPPIAYALGERIVPGVPGPVANEGKDGHDVPFGSENGTGLAEVERRLLQVIRSPWLSFLAVPLIVHAFLLASILAPMVLKPPQTLERGWRGGLLVAFGCLALLPVTGNYSRLLATWVAFDRFLRRLAHAPAVAALRRLPSPLARSLEAQLGLSGSEISDLVFPVQALDRLAAVVPALRCRHDECERLLHEELRYEAGPAGGAIEPGTRRAKLVTALLQTSAELTRSRAESPEQIRSAIDDFGAAMLAVFIPRYVRHFRLFVPPLVLGSVLSILMTSLYFVQPRRLITSIAFVWVAAFVLTIFIVYVALDRDPVISAMCNSTAGAVTWNWALARRVVSWGLLPMASLVAAQYPQFSFWISTMFDVFAKGFR
jgi:hypothetical protein